MKRVWQTLVWVLRIVLGNVVYSIGFSMFLSAGNMNAGGLSGLAMVAVKLLGFGTVGSLVLIVNIPLVLIGGMKVNRQFFLGTAISMVIVSPLIDLFALIRLPEMDSLVAALYGGVICGAGLGIVFLAGASTGGSDVVVRLLKRRYQNVPIGVINTMFDVCVITLTGLVFQDITKTLYSGIAVFVTGQVIDAVVYRFDYSKVALIMSHEHEAIAREVGLQLHRGATYLNGEGSYKGEPVKVVLVAVKKQQVADLKRVVSEVDPKAFVIVQEAHQVLGDGFAHYSKDSL